MRRKTTVICRNPDVVGGTPVFCGTRVPVQTLLDYLEAGERAVRRRKRRLLDSCAAC